MIKTGNPCFDPATNTIDLGSTFREFLDLIGVHIGGRQLKSVKPQMERLFKCVYIISNNTEATSQGVNFTVAEKYQIDWLNPNLPSQRGKSTANWVQLSKGYVAMLADHPVPVDLKVISRLRKPLALDIYWWLTKRVYGLHEPVAITWQRLYQQFGSDTKELWKFKQSFKEALAEVLKVYDCNITCGPERVTVYPSRTSVPTVTETRAVEKRRAATEGHWIPFMGVDEAVFWTSDAFNPNDAQCHLFGLVDTEKCPICAYDERNRNNHESFANTLF